MNTSTAHAAFLVIPHKGGIAATTRTVDRGEAGRIGLPGGKIDPGETGEAAARREAREEGWWLPNSARLYLCHRDDVEGLMVEWYALNPLDSDISGTLSRIQPIRDGEYAESGRVHPITVGLDQIASSGYGNDFLSHWSWVDGVIVSPLHALALARRSYYVEPAPLPRDVRNAEQDADCVGRPAPRWVREAIAAREAAVTAARASASERFLESDEAEDLIADSIKYQQLRGVVK